MEQFVKVGTCNINLDNVKVVDEQLDGVHVYFIGENASYDWLFENEHADDLRDLFANTRTARQIVAERGAERAPDYETLLTLVRDAAQMIHAAWHFKPDTVNAWLARARTLLEVGE